MEKCQICLTYHYSRPIYARHNATRSSVQIIPLENEQGKGMLFPLDGCKSFVLWFIFGESKDVSSGIRSRFYTDYKFPDTTTFTIVFSDVLCSHSCCWQNLGLSCAILEWKMERKRCGNGYLQNWNKWRHWMSPPPKSTNYQIKINKIVGKSSYHEKQSLDDYEGACRYQGTLQKVLKLL